MKSRRRLFSRALGALSLSLLSFLMFHTVFSSLPDLGSGRHFPALHSDHSDKESRKAQKMREGGIDEWERGQESSKGSPAL